MLIVIVFVLGIWQFFYLRHAHSSFDNYYAFRNCQELLSKTDNDGICRLKDGSTIKIVKYQGKWYLDGDLPQGFLSL